MTDPELELFAREWNRCLAEADRRGAAALRGEGYELIVPEGEVLTADQEVAYIGDEDFRTPAVALVRMAAERDGDRAILTLENRVSGRIEGVPVRETHVWRLDCRRADGTWTARRAELTRSGRAPLRPDRPRQGGFRRLAGRAARRLGFRRPREIWSRAVAFGRLAYLPYRPGDDFILPPAPSEPPRTAEGGFPVPPESLWTDARYSAHGDKQVAAMLGLVEESGLAFRDGDRILDLGCGPGRMIRHLLPLAEKCEIWGVDIDSESILWCQRHLSPPFHFATTTKVPHLPFADGSFRFVYCGSLFTHIDDLADSWLLELRRILAPDGRLFLTLHDDRTVALLEAGRYAKSDMARALRASPTYQAAVKTGFAMFAIGRDSDSQIFYARDWFERRAAPSFAILSVTDEAYYYQTGYVLAPRGRP
jgi:SAM-dependent methyltransferase